MRKRLNGLVASCQHATSTRDNKKDQRGSKVEGTRRLAALVIVVQESQRSIEAEYDNLANRHWVAYPALASHRESLQVADSAAVGV